MRHDCTEKEKNSVGIDRNQKGYPANDLTKGSKEKQKDFGCTAPGRHVKLCEKVTKNQGGPSEGGLGARARGHNPKKNGKIASRKGPGRREHRLGRSPTNAQPGTAWKTWRANSGWTRGPSRAGRNSQATTKRNGKGSMKKIPAPTITQ